MSEIEKALARLEIAKKHKSKDIRLSIFDYERLINEIIILQQKLVTLSTIDTPKKSPTPKTIILDGQSFK